MTDNQLIAIQNRLSEIKGERKNIKRRTQELHDEEQALFQSKKEVKKNVRKKNEKEINVKVTDHAVLRWLERVHGIDVERLRQSIVSDKDKEMIALGARKIKSGKRILVIEGQTVVTVISKGSVE